MIIIALFYSICTCINTYVCHQRLLYIRLVVAVRVVRLFVLFWHGIEFVFIFTLLQPSSSPSSSMPLTYLNLLYRFYFELVSNWLNTNQATVVQCSLSLLVFPIDGDVCVCKSLLLPGFCWWVCVCVFELNDYLSLCLFKCIGIVCECVCVFRMSICRGRFMPFFTAASPPVHAVVSVCVSMSLLIVIFLLC